MKNVAEAIAVIRAEWRRMAADGVTDAELDAVQDLSDRRLPAAL